eukprot:757059-Hanusia_phi.AAC.1
MEGDEVGKDKHREGGGGAGRRQGGRKKGQGQEKKEIDGKKRRESRGAEGVGAGRVPEYGWGRVIVRRFKRCKESIEGGVGTDLNRGGVRCQQRNSMGGVYDRWWGLQK